MDLEQAITDLTPRLLRYCTARTGSASLAEDVTHDALVALVHRWRRYGPPESVEAFVFVIAKRRSTRAVFRQRLFMPLSHLAGHHDGHRDPEHQTIDRAERDVAFAAVAKLASRDREALLLVAVAGLDTAAASRCLGITSGAFKVRVHRARRRLAELMGNHHGQS